MILIDYIIISIILLSIVVSFIRRFSGEMISLLTWVIAFFISTKYYKYIYIYLISLLHSSIASNVISISLLFILTLILGSIVNRIINNFIQKIGLTDVDVLLGTLFGLVRGVVIVLFAIFLLEQFIDFSTIEYLQSSYLITTFKDLIEIIKNKNF
ncbi:MAG: CvpA family protein [Enterobacterales bacterium]